jgi:hypothetical protein
MSDIPGPKYDAIRREIDKATDELLALDPENEVMQLRIDMALRDLEVAKLVLVCGQSQSALDPGPRFRSPGDDEPA